MSEAVIDLKDFNVSQTINGDKATGMMIIENKETNEKYIAQILKSNNDEEKDKKAFLDEFKNISSLNYPSILHFVGYSELDFDSQKNLTIILDYMSNNTLKSYLTRDQQDPTTKFIMLLGISLGMKFLHSKENIYGQLNPSNILIDDQFFPKLPAFGLSKKMNEKTNYTAPEIKINDLFTLQSDVYSFSIIAYELITGKQSPVDIPSIPGEENQRFFARCISEDPKERPNFIEISRFILKKKIMSLFGEIDLDKVNSYLDLYENDDEVLFLHGVMLSEFDKEKCVQYYKKAISKGNSNAMNNYASMLKKGSGVPANKEEAVKYYLMGIERGDTISMNNYANMLHNGDGVKTDKKEAFKYYKMAADKGHDSSMLNYANMLFNGDGVETNKEEAIKYYKKAIEKGNSSAMYNYALILKSGNGVEANKFYKMAAERGNSSAMLNYANMLFNGDGVEVDKKEA